ncbi:MAG: hypothetical protein ACQES9_02220 [Myxococcota bacterium]
MREITLEDIVENISSSYDKTDEFNFSFQTMTSLFGMGTKSSHPRKYTIIRT